jgi:hypothetical protein
VDTPRKPTIKMESTEPHSIRFTPTQWTSIQAAARRRGEEPSRYVRRLTMYALSIVQAQAAAQDHVGVTHMGGL